MAKKILGVVLCLVFIGGFGAGGILMLAGVVRQARTSAWPPADEGHVLTSRVARSGKGLAPVVEYRYRVGAKWYDSARIAIGGEFSSSDGVYARSTVARFPAGTAATVYVDPADPRESVPSHGLDNHQFQRVAFAFPFLAISVAFLVATVSWYARRGRGYVARVRVFEPAPGVTVARDNALTPVASAFFSIAGVSFIGVFVVLFVLSSHALAGVIGLFTLALGAGVAAFIWRRRWLAAGRADTVIDANAGLLLLARGRNQAVDAIPLAAISSVTLEERQCGKKEKSAQWWLTAHTTPGAKPRDLVQVYSQADGPVLQRWFSDRIEAAKRGRA
ncbi:MAG: DUF3592 domain-containing protein [Phycisphaerales bacterium]|nr:DUF3592 domain-containing protein [Phycisphaerales bacterium]